MGNVVDWPGGVTPDYLEGPHAVCLPFPEKGPNACATAYSNACILSNYACGLSGRGERVAGPLPSTKGCCWKVEGRCPIGRPFVVDGVARLAPLRDGSGWIPQREGDDASLDAMIAALAPDTRAAIADVWIRDALTEHASIASFAQFILELLALGAPAKLVDDAQRASSDEVRHAERAFALAARYGSIAREPGALDVGGMMRHRIGLADFAARTAAEGCIAETVAALQLHAAADVAANDNLASELRKTADEESEHALLAWRVVGWAIERGGEPVREAVGQVFDQAASHVGFGPCVDEDLASSASVVDLRAHGILPRADRHDLAVQVLESVIAPAAEALTPSPSRRSIREAWRGCLV